MDDLEKRILAAIRHTQIVMRVGGATGSKRLIDFGPGASKRNSGVVAEGATWGDVAKQLDALKPSWWK